MSGVGASQLGVVPDYILDEMEQRYQGFAVPAGPFDPSTASQLLLRQYGLPPRPDPVGQKRLRAAWDRGFGRPITLEPFKFERAIARDTRFRLHSRHVDEVALAETRFESSSNWSGAYITSNRDRKFLQIWGAWTVPGNLQLPPGPLQGPATIDYLCSNWIGLDGQRLYFDSSLPQMGTVSTLLADGTTGAEAWTQWWARGTANAAPLPLCLPVSPGDDVLCVVTACDPQNAVFVMVNVSTATGIAVQGTSPTVTLPNGAMAQPCIAGATAEWIMERPRIPGEPTHYNFPDYGQTEFDLCIAVEGDEVDIFSWFSGVPQELEGSRRIRMFQVLDNPARTAFVSMPRKLDDSSVRVKYGGLL